MNSVQSWSVEELRWSHPLVEHPQLQLGLRCLVVDDDPVFCRAITRAGRKKGISVQSCSGLPAITMLPDRLPYDIVILDYYFRGLTGTQLSYLLGKNLPVVMVSSSQQSKLFDSDWPSCVKEFVHKGRGVDAILNTAVKVVGVSPRPNPETTVPAAIPARNPVLWLLFVTIVAAAACLSFLFQQSSLKPGIYWDKVNQPQVEVADFLIRIDSGQIIKDNYFSRLA